MINGFLFALHEGCKIFVFLNTKGVKKRVTSSKVTLF